MLAEIERPADIVLLNRSAFVQQRKQRDLRGAQVNVGGLQVGLILHPLQLQPVQVNLRDVTGLKAGSADIEHMIVIGQVIFRQL